MPDLIFGIDPARGQDRCSCVVGRSLDGQIEVLAEFDNENDMQKFIHDEEKSNHG